VCSVSSNSALCVWFYGGVFGDGGSNSVTSGWIKFKTVPRSRFENLNFSSLQYNSLHVYMVSILCPR